ncbi:hypothetical protein JOQ06_020113 [Pogonophryne albipinna]|uniref:F-box only protein 9 n=1 Tax=Pogonophryne albipinna TaxID=1090488 RepID=A0AAD6BNL6_9TELE|nr:hypothetical protein JOQ06_020113 [Pogonophryne albipinna]
MHPTGPPLTAEENTDISSMIEDEDSDDPNIQTELTAFRAQWMSELKTSSGAGGWSGRQLRAQGLKRTQDIAREEKATELFLRAVQEEQKGAVYVAIKFYRMAMQLTRLEGNTGRTVLMLDFTQMHISELPREILMYIFRWVVSSELDMRALQQLSLVCRGFYMCARDPEIWHSACSRVWGRNCTKIAPFKSWREMFLQRPRVRFDGVYISKTSYIRQGEASLDGFYRAWHHIEYYRYLRFFSDGHVVMVTSPDDPLSVVPRLRTKNVRMESVLHGHYRLSQETDNQTKVFAVVCKKKEEKATEFQKNRFCRRNQSPEVEHNFHVGLHLSSGGRQSLSKLSWIHHSCHITYKLSGEMIITAFDLDSMYQPFIFARVKSYTAFSIQPL